MTRALVQLEKAGGAATVLLDSPHNRNALSRQLLTELESCLDAALADRDVRAVVITNTGGVFCSGADLKERLDSGGPGDAPPFHDVLTLLCRASKPVIARVAGHVRAGGMGIVAACDIVVADESSTFATSEVRVGAVPAAIAVVLLRKLGLTAASELFLTGEPVAARRAAEIGLVTAAVPLADIDSTVDRYVRAFRLAGPDALAGTKQVIQTLSGADLAGKLEQMAARSEEIFRGAEAREGMQAFLERRPPAWAEGVG